MLTIESLRIEYPTGEGPVIAVNDVSVSLNAGEFFTLLGPSGCGKTSTLRAVAGLETPVSGKIQIGPDVVFSSSPRRNVPTHRREIGMGFQSYAIWPHMTVEQNVTFPLQRGRGRISKQVARSRAAEALELVRLGHLASRPATDLSGGQQQRVALARALVREPNLLLLDEPLSNLDAKLRDEMRSEITQVVTRLGMTTLYVTHDQTEALSMSDRVAVMRDGDIVQCAPPRDLYLYPRTEFVADFVGQSNTMAGTILRTEAAPPGSPAGWTGVEVDVGGAWGAVRGIAHTDNGTSGTQYISFRPEAATVTLADSAPSPTDGTNSIDGVIESQAFLGPIIEYVVHTSAGKYCVIAEPFAAVHEVGARVRISVRPTRCVVFPAPSDRPALPTAETPVADDSDDLLASSAVTIPADEVSA